MLARSPRPTRSPGSGRALLTRLLVLLASTAFALCVGEAVFRVHHFGWRALRPSEMRSIRPLGQAGLLRATDYERPRYALRPNLRTRFKMAAFETNSRGLRDREYALAKPPGTFRIAALGDSFTMGSGVPIERVFHSLVEEELNARADGTRYEVWNFGVGGYAIRDSIGVIEHELPAIDADLVLLCLCGNDRSPERRPPPPFREKPAVDYSWRLNVWSSWLERLESPLAPRRVGSSWDLLERHGVRAERLDRSPASWIQSSLAQLTACGGAPFGSVGALLRSARWPLAQPMGARVPALCSNLGSPLTTARSRAAQVGSVAETGDPLAGDAESDSSTVRSAANGRRAETNAPSRDTARPRRPRANDERSPAKTAAERALEKVPAHVRQYFEELRTCGERAGIPLIVVGLAAHRDFERATTGLGLEYVPAGEALPNGLERRLWIFPDDGHPNEEANAAYAGALLEHLLASGHLPR